MTANKSNSESLTRAAAEKIAAAGKETLETAVKTGSETAEKSYRSATAAGKEQIHLASDSYNRALSAGRDNLDAVSEAATAAVSGWEAYCEGLIDCTRTAAASHLDVMQRFFTVKTPQEFLDLQIESTKLAVSRAVDQSTRLNGIAADAMTRTLEPIKRRVDSTVEAFTRPVGASR